MADRITSWVIKVKAAAHLEPVIIGNVETGPSEGRDHATAKAWALVYKHFDERAKIIGIAKGRLTVTLHGEWEEL